MGNPKHPVQIRAESALRCKYCHGRLKLASEQHRHWSVPRRHWSRPESNPLSTARRVLTERLSTVPGAPGTSRPKNYWVARRMAVKSRQQGRASSRASSRGPPALSREAQNLHEVDGKSAAEATRPSGTGLPPSGTPQVSWCCRSGLRVRTCLLCGEVPELVGKALLTKERSSHSTHRTASHLPGAYKLATPLVHNVPRTVLVRQPSRNNDDPQRRDPRSHKLHTYTRPQNALSFG